MVAYSRLFSLTSLMTFGIYHSYLHPVEAWQQSKAANSRKEKIHDFSRRGALGKFMSLATCMFTSAAVETSNPQASFAQPPLNLPVLQLERTLSSSSSPFLFDAYYITPDEANVRSKLDKMDSQKFLRELASSRAGSVWLGEHHNSLKDHDFQAGFIREIYKQRKRQQQKNAPMAIGLEQVQNQFQPILDAYIDGKISLDHMRFMVQWDKRWMWRFENYKKIFETAKEFKIRLLALNVDSEDLSIVEKEGYPGLPKERLHKYIKDPVGFSTFATSPDFKSYVDYVIQPSYELHQRMGLLRYTMLGEQMEEEMTFRRFLSGRLLWDEGMASEAFAWCGNNPGGLLIGLVGADHVKFKNGIPGRFSRMAAKDKLLDCTTVVINPTLIDSRPSGTVANIPTSDSAEYPDRITLQLRYVKSDPGMDVINTGPGVQPEKIDGVLAFSDFVVVT